jgi:hypothetical protein
MAEEVEKQGRGAEDASGAEEAGTGAEDASGAEELGRGRRTRAVELGRRTRRLGYGLGLFMGLSIQLLAHRCPVFL